MNFSKLLTNDKYRIKYVLHFYMSKERNFVYEILHSVYITRQQLQKFIVVHYAEKEYFFEQDLVLTLSLPTSTMLAKETLLQL